MELRHLRYFVTVAEEMHFGRAAKRLNMAQPPLSLQIQKLENEVGAVLFYRTKRSVNLTDAGKVFLENAIQILSRVEKASEVTRQVHQGEAGQLIIGFTGTTTYDLLPILQNYRLRFPSVDVVLQRLGTAAQIQALQEDRIHVGLLITPVEIKSFNFLPLRQQCFVAALPEIHPLAGTDQLEVSELADESFILTPRGAGSNYYDAIISICNQAGFVPKVTLEAHELETIIHFVSVGMGISLVPYRIQEMQAKGVVYKELKGVITTIETSIAWRSDEKSHVVHKFIELFKEIR